jgi:ABC-type antimicrobial peptide transport system permease subunit
MALVFSEALIPCLVGAVLGTGLADLMTRLPADYLPHDFSGIPKPSFTPEVLAWSIACALVLAVASAIFPLLRLLHMSVTDALAGR